MNKKKGLKDWLGERFPLSTFNYEVPPHANTFLFSLGGITLISVIVLIITGAILTQYYTPNPEAANQSIRIFMTQVKLGSLVRSIHVWAAQFAVASLVLHLLRVLFFGSYKKPREINWIMGVFLFVFMAGFFFTGTIIKWDQEGYEALSHTVAIGQLIGGPLKNYLAPNDISLLSKFFSIHTSILPILLTVVLLLHLYLIKVLKISPLPWETKKRIDGKHNFFQHLSKLGGYFLIMISLLFALAVLFPASIGPLPLKGIESARPPWLFMPIFSIENWFGIKGLIFSSTAIIILLFLVPLLDRSRTHRFKDRKGLLAILGLAVLIVAALTVNAYVAKPGQHIGMGGEEETTQQIPTQHQSVPQVIDQALTITEQLKDALVSKDVEAANSSAEKLDDILDPLKEVIEEKDADLVNSLATDSLLDILSSQKPDFVNASAIADQIEEALQQSKTIFPINTTVNGIDDSILLVSDIKSAVTINNFELAQDRASTLDETLDPLKDAINDKNPDLVEDLNVEAVMDKLAEINPDTSEINSLLDAMTQSLNKAKSLFDTSGSSVNPLADSSEISSKLTTAMGMVDLIKNAINNNNMTRAQDLAVELDEGLDPLKDAVQAKSTYLVEQLTTDSLLEMLEEENPNITQINKALDSFHQALAKTIDLFE